MFCRSFDSTLVCLEISSAEVEKQLNISQKTRRRYCQILRRIAPKLGIQSGQTYFTLRQLAAIELVRNWSAARMLPQFVKSCNLSGFPYESL